MIYRNEKVFFVLPSGMKKYIGFTVMWKYFWIVLLLRDLIYIYILAIQFSFLIGVILEPDHLGSLTEWVNKLKDSKINWKTYGDLKMY